MMEIVAGCRWDCKNGDPDAGILFGETSQNSNSSDRQGSFSAFELTQMSQTGKLISIGVCESLIFAVINLGRWEK